jgi:hypothetical protein
MKRFSVGLQQQATDTIEAAKHAMSTWVGTASNAFTSQAARRATELSKTAAAVDVAPEALLRYAESISGARTVHAEVSAMYDQYVVRFPETEAILNQLVTAQGDAVGVANTAAQCCADTLRSITQNVNGILYGLSWLQPYAPYQFGQPGSIFDQPGYNGPQISASPTPYVSQQPQPFDFAAATHTAKSAYKTGLWSLETYELWVHLNEHRIKDLIKTNGANGGKPFLRGGREVLAWKPGAGLTATEGTLAQTTARLAKIHAQLAKLKVVVKGATVIGAAFSGVVQVADDWDGNYTTTQRTARAGTSVVLEGGGAILGFKAGVAAGAAIGVWAGGVGAVPGAIIGGVCGVIGALFFGWLGKKAKEEIFEEGPEEVFGGQVERERESAR